MTNNNKKHAGNSPDLLRADELALTPDDKYPLTAVLEIDLGTNSSYRLHPRIHDLLAKVMSHRGPVVAQSGELVRIVFGAVGPHVDAGYVDALGVAEDVMATIGLAGFPITSLNVSTPSVEPARAPVLVGLREAADILGVSRQRAAQLAARPDFPQPLQRLRATPVWLESDVRRFHLNRQAASSRTFN